ncbi:MAG: PilZ domain-containing protein [Planctomycetaceae bacterium]|nr:PilZ domain-containing protein [Planctomycetaceae bacterium]MCA9098458.1 PilZ domain-containing protein [Planctomycetaceae bacterium]
MSNSPSPSHEVPDKALQRVLADLAREDQRNSQLYGRDRNFERKSIILKVAVAPYINDHLVMSNQQSVWVRNLSRSGISFVSKAPIGCKSVGVHLLQGNNGPIWMQGEVVRERQIQDGFWEFGVEFIASIKV